MTKPRDAQDWTCPPTVVETSRDDGTRPSDYDVRRALRAYFGDDDEPITDYEMEAMRAALTVDRAGRAS